MTELLILVTGFMAGLRLWLGSYDIVVARRKKVGVDRSRKIFLALGRFGSAVAFGVLVYAIATPGTTNRAFSLTAYLLGALLLLVGSIGELVTYDWREGDGEEPFSGEAS